MACRGWIPPSFGTCRARFAEYESVRSWQLSGWSVTMSMMDTGEVTIVRGACPHDCPDTCATLVEVRNGVAVGFGADANHPITQGWLCAKVRPYLQRVYAPDRLQYPIRRTGPKGSGEWARISWDEAIAEICQRWQSIIDADGAAAILPYSFSGTLGL